MYKSDKASIDTSGIWVSSSKIIAQFNNVILNQGPAFPVEKSIKTIWPKSMS